MRIRRYKTMISLAFLSLLFVVGGVALGQGLLAVETEIDRLPADRFDPSLPPSDLGVGEAGLCRIRHAASHHSTMTLTTTRLSSGYRVELTTERITTTLGLSTQLVIPYHANSVLIAHEEGHRSIAEALHTTYAEMVAEYAYAAVAGSLLAVDSSSAAYGEQVLRQRFAAMTGAANRYSLAVLAAVDETFNDMLYHQLLDAVPVRSSGAVVQVSLGVIDEACSSDVKSLIEDALWFGCQEAGAPSGTLQIVRAEEAAVEQVTDRILSAYGQLATPEARRRALRLHAALIDSSESDVWRNLLAKVVLLGVAYQEEMQRIRVG